MLFIKSVAKQNNIKIDRQTDKDTMFEYPFL